jgi:hypothetical protein
VGRLVWLLEEVDGTCNWAFVSGGRTGRRVSQAHQKLYQWLLYASGMPIGSLLLGKLLPSPQPAAR